MYIQLHEVQFWLWKYLNTGKLVCEVILIVYVCYWTRIVQKEQD